MRRDIIHAPTMLPCMQCSGEGTQVTFQMARTSSRRTAIFATSFLLDGSLDATAKFGAEKYELRRHHGPTVEYGMYCHRHHV
jgi:hypothetical protein